MYRSIFSNISYKSNLIQFSLLILLLKNTSDAMFLVFIL